VPERANLKGEPVERRSVFITLFAAAAGLLLLTLTGPVPIAIGSPARHGASAPSDRQIDTFLLLKAVLSQDEAVAPAGRATGKPDDTAAFAPLLTILPRNSWRPAPETLSPFTKVYLVSPQRLSPWPRDINPRISSYDRLAQEGAIGFVVVAALVDTLGSVTKAEVLWSLTTDPRLDSAALACARQAAFAPRMSDGERRNSSKGAPVEAWAAIAYISRFSSAYPGQPTSAGLRRWKHPREDLSAPPCRIDTSALVKAVLSDDDSQREPMTDRMHDTLSSFVESYLVSPPESSPRPISIAVHNDRTLELCWSSYNIGYVAVAVYVDTDGTVTRANVLQGLALHTELEPWAVSWARKAQFEPLSRKGKPVGSWATIAYVARFSRHFPRRYVIRQ
jgi:TonB family protein